MPRRRSLSSLLYRAARTARTAESIERSVETGDPSYAERRAVNIAKGRLLRRLGFWRWLWK
jgi:hypothetical protein